MKQHHEVAIVLTAIVLAFGLIVASLAIRDEHTVASMIVMAAATGLGVLSLFATFILLKHPTRT